MKKLLKGGVIVGASGCRKADLLIDGERIEAVGEALSCPEAEEIDVSGKLLFPGFLDAHTHFDLEVCNTVTADDFYTGGRSALRGGTTTVIADPHEIVNVCGAKAVDYLLDATEHLPLNVYLMLPSSVPATPFETNGADFTPADMAPYLGHPRVLGLGEVMNYPAAVAGDAGVLEKVALAQACGKLADGHAPGISGKDLQAYAALGIATEHECTTFAEAAEKLRGKILHLDRDDVDLPEDLVFIQDILTFKVYDLRVDRVIGHIRDVLTSNPAHDMYEIAGEDGRLIYIPAIKPFLKEIDMDAGIVYVESIEGLIE